MRRHQLTDEQWDAVEPVIPVKQARRGRPPEDPREMLDGILWGAADRRAMARLARPVRPVADGLRLLQRLA